MEGAARVPEVQELANLTVKELINLTNLTIKKVEWNGLNTLSFTLSNGEYCKAGSKYKVENRHTFDPNKKITKVECFIHDYKRWILQINFYSGQETLVQVGWPDWRVKDHRRRVESFEIAADEQLIGAELYYNHLCFKGVTFLKCKVFK